MVPAVAGQTQAAAEAAIAIAGLTVGSVTSAGSDTVPAGDVVTQTSSAGARVEPGSAVDLMVSSGPVLVTVPSLAGQTQAAAEAAITAADLTVGTVTRASADMVPAGDVISQTPAAGVSVAPGSAVDLVISSGPATQSDTLTCKLIEYKREEDRLSIEVRTTDRTGARTMTAAMDLDGEGTFERDLGVIPVMRGSSVTFKRDNSPFANPNPTASSVVRVTSDLGGVCTRDVKID